MNHWLNKKNDVEYLKERGFHFRPCDGHWDHVVGYYIRNGTEVTKLDGPDGKTKPTYGATLIIQNGEVSASWSWGEEYIMSAISKLDNLPSGKPKRVYGPHDAWMREHNSHLYDEAGNYVGD
jgi:hypothetical protein